MENWIVLLIIAAVMLAIWLSIKLLQQSRPAGTIDSALPNHGGEPEYPGTRPRKVKPGTHFPVKKVRETRNEDEEDFGTSMAVTAMTENPLLGLATGRSITGTMVGAALAANSADDDRRSSYSENSYSDSSSSSDSGSSGGGD